MNLKTIVSGFVLLLIGVIFIGIVADQVATNTDTYATTNETISIAATAGQTQGTENVALTLFQNVSHQFVGGQDINVTTDGVVSANVSNGNYNITYGYTNENYITDSTSRALLGVVILFFALAILAVGAGMVIVGFKNMGTF